MSEIYLNKTGLDKLAEVIADKFATKAEVPAALPTTTTAGQVLKSTSTSGTVQWGSIPDGITEISTQYIRITDLSAGVYKLTYAGTKYIYYSGTSGTSTHTVTGSSGAVILVVSRYSTTYWHWYYINGGSVNYSYIYFGYTSSSVGYYSSKALNSLLTSAVTSLNGSTGAITNVLQQSSTTTTADKIMLSTTTANQGSWSDLKTVNGTSLIGSGDITISGGTPTDVQINGTSITSNNVANIITNTAYNSSTNKIATMSDVPDVSGKQNTLQAKGSTTKPIYVSSAGTISETNTYAGGTAVTLNGTSKAATTASFYAPTTAISTSTSKRYLVGSSSTTSVATENTNSSCYMSSGKLYSNGNEVVTLSDSQALTNKTYNGYTLGAACAKSTTTTVTDGSADLITSGAVYSETDSIRKRFDTYEIVSGDPKQNPGANTSYRATALTCVIIWMDSDVSGSLNNSSGINFFTSSDGSNWTQVARFNSTSGYPKFGNICCVVPKGAYFKTNYWGMGSNNLVKMTRIILDHYSA